MTTDEREVLMALAESNGLIRMFDHDVVIVADLPNTLFLIKLKAFADDYAQYIENSIRALIQDTPDKLG